MSFDYKMGTFMQIYSSNIRKTFFYLIDDVFFIQFNAIVKTEQRITMF